MVISLFAITGFASSSYCAEADLFVLSEYTVDEPEEYFTLELNDDVEITSVVSSKPDVVSVEEDGVYGSFVYLYAHKVGTAVITATDVNGDTDVCTVKVIPPELVLETYVVDFSNYDGNDRIFTVYSDSNYLSSAVSSNKSVVKVELEEKFGIKITPVAAGTATITVTDVYKQKKTIDVSVTQKFVDDMNYLDAFREASPEDVYYGDQDMYFYLNIRGVSLIVTANGKTYTGVYDSEVYYVTIPRLPVGTVIKYTLSKGETTYSSSLSVKKASITARSDIYLNKSVFQYTGKNCVPYVSVDYYFEGSDELFYLRKGTDYTVTYKNNKDVGTATAVVSGKGNYTGTMSKTFTIIPKGTSIAKVKAAKKSFTVKWKKQAANMSKSKITGYQVRYSTKSSMSGSKIVTVKGYASTSKKIKKLKAKKKYYVQVRTFKKVGAKYFYSGWSAKKKVKTK